MHLIVKQPFGGYAKGDVITDARTVATVLAGENADHVLRMTPPVDAPPSDEPAAADAAPVTGQE